MTRTTQDFNEASVGSAFMPACGLCGRETGEIAIKTRGLPNAPRYDGPRVLRVEHARCEWCAALEAWAAQAPPEVRERIDAHTIKAGMVKIVDRDDGKLVAWLAITSEDGPLVLATGASVDLRHGMTLDALRSEKALTLVGVRKEPA